MNSKNKNNTFLVIFLAVTCGLVAGVFGEIITRVYLLSDYSFPYLSSDVNLNELNNNQSNLIIRDPKKVVVNQDIKVTETLNSLATSLVGVYREVKVKAGADLTKPDYYELDEPLFQGLVVTSDGWVISSLSQEMSASFIAKGFVAIGANRKIYQIDKVKTLPEVPGNVVLFHLAAATDLSVRKIVARPELSLGQSLIVLDNERNVWPTSLASFRKTPTVLNSDELNARLSLATESATVQKNSFVFNLSGDLVAVIGDDQEVIPAFAYNFYWQNLSLPETVLRPFLGVNYLDLSVVRLPDFNFEKGALIYSPEGKAAVVKNSPAANSGLIAGDIITWINNQEINKYNDLADVISRFKPGDKITISYLRQGEERQLDLKLGELK